MMFVISLIRYTYTVYYANPFIVHTGTRNTTVLYTNIIFRNYAVFYECIFSTTTTASPTTPLTQTSTPPQVSPTPTTTPHTSSPTSPAT